MAADLSGAGFILNTGLFDDEREDESHYENFLAEAHARGLAMICANPDRAVVRGDRLVPCAGLIAEAYERRGGRVIYFGKPHAGAYAACFERLDGTPRHRILAVGDGLPTDIAGANAAGIDRSLHRRRAACGGACRRAIPGPGADRGRLRRRRRPRGRRDGGPALVAAAPSIIRAPLSGQGGPPRPRCRRSAGRGARSRSASGRGVENRR